MSGNQSKIPDEKLRQELAAGLKVAEIAARYGLTANYLRRRIHACVLCEHRAAARVVVPTYPYIVITKRVPATDNGGIALAQIRLPRISMHLAFIDQARHGVARA
jgi:hypothetical protein